MASHFLSLPSSKVDGRVTVVAGRRSSVVDMERLTRSRRDGFVCLADIWIAARLPGSLAELTFDFMGADSFRPSQMGDGLLLGRALEDGFVELATKNLAWEDSLGLPCFFRVKSLTMVIATEGNEASLPEQRPRARGDFGCAGATPELGASARCSCGHPPPEK